MDKAGLARGGLLLQWILTSLSHLQLASGAVLKRSQQSCAVCEASFLGRPLLSSQVTLSLCGTEQRLAAGCVRAGQTLQTHHGGSSLGFVL